VVARRWSVRARRARQFPLRPYRMPICLATRSAALRTSKTVCQVEHHAFLFAKRLAQAVDSFIGVSDGGRHRVSRHRSYGRRHCCARFRHGWSYANRHRRRSYARYYLAQTFASKSGNAASEPNTAAPRPNNVGSEPERVAHLGSAATVPRLHALRSAMSRRERPVSPIGFRTLTASRIQPGSSFPCRPIGWN
jgi:hypothetical protein